MFVVQQRLIKHLTDINIVRQKRPPKMCNHKHICLCCQVNCSKSTIKFCNFERLFMFSSFRTPSISGATLVLLAMDPHQLVSFPATPILNLIAMTKKVRYAVPSIKPNYKSCLLAFMNRQILCSI